MCCDDRQDSRTVTAFSISIFYPSTEKITFKTKLFNIQLRHRLEP